MTTVAVSLSIDTDRVPAGFLRIVSHAVATDPSGFVLKQVRFRMVATLENMAGNRKRIAEKVARWADRNFDTGYRLVARGSGLSQPQYHGGNSSNACSGPFGPLSG